MDLENKYGTLEIQNKLLTLLKEFHQFCLDNDIKYSLDWGSLLGAVRHKGFIPWDDDIDIMVDRCNYNKIIEKANSPITIERNTPSALWIDRVRLESDAVQSPKPTMDIFVIDNAPDGIYARKLRVLGLRFLQGMLKSKPNFRKGTLFLRIASLISFFIGGLFTRKTKLKLYSWLSQKSNKEETERKASYNTDFADLPKLYAKDVIDEVIEVPFENIFVYITKSYHRCLVDKFGPDYMTPPSVQNRIPKHS